ncbi:lipocalin family protein [Sedimentimonas flavescens]|uniref:Lipocalin family protein n=1 Tax=Sedimentimonas flavescens TaxID=2851012 RepID=A0ABT2ZWG4_9RHOB|nr:lipocalin family protein [Sedimentimonas flavescens]MCV2878065.1 lipocalin family protein [Sedimentimonas flavescens]
MRRLIPALLCLLAACAAPPPEQGLRNREAMISSAVVFDPARFAGRWHVAASGVPGCAGAAQDWALDERGAYVLSGIDCSGTRPAHLTGRAVITGPGARFAPDAGFGRAPVWVLWVDQDYRIAVLGTPEGQFGMIVTRELPPRADLMAAAQEVLAFNGYDLRRIGR